MEIPTLWWNENYFPRAIVLARKKVSKRVEAFSWTYLWHFISKKLQIINWMSQHTHTQLSVDIKNWFFFSYFLHSLHRRHLVQPFPSSRSFLAIALVWSKLALRNLMAKISPLTVLHHITWKKKGFMFKAIKNQWHFMVAYAVCNKVASGRWRGFV